MLSINKYFFIKVPFHAKRYSLSYSLVRFKNLYFATLPININLYIIPGQPILNLYVHKKKKVKNKKIKGKKVQTKFNFKKYLKYN